NTEALFTKPELITRGRLAVLGLNPEQEQILMARYIKTFSGQVITFVERKQLANIIGEQDLLKGRLNENTRAKIKQVFGVEALVMCEYYDAKTARGGKKLRIRIVDSETGVIIGSVITQAPDNFAKHSSTAIKALLDDLMGKSQPERADRVERKRKPLRRI
ncbi:MAG: CsgG/HfaB family protein, partial [Planctomycetota bacterium]